VKTEINESLNQKICVTLEKEQQAGGMGIQNPMRLSHQQKRKTVEPANIKMKKPVQKCAFRKILNLFE